MLTIIVPATELFDDRTQQFKTGEEVVLELEHSLFSIALWESKWEKPFLASEEKTTEEVYDYVRCMTMNDGVPDDVYPRLSEDNIRSINDHIAAKMTATWFNEPKTYGAAPKKEIITAEVVYYWMASLQIPFECQYWHFNRLMTLVKVCNLKNNPPKQKKMSRAELAARNRSLNDARRAQMNTAG